MPAGRAQFRAGMPPVDYGHGPAVPVGLVLHLAAELAPPAVGNRFRQGPVTDHVLHGEVFDGDRVVAADQAGRGLVEEILSGVADFRVGAGDFRFGLAPIRRFAEPFWQRAKRR